MFTLTDNFTKRTQAAEENIIGLADIPAYAEEYKNRYRKTDADVKLHDSQFAFVKTELAKVHENVKMPIYHFTYQDDVPINVGGGFKDYVRYFSVDFQGIVDDSENLFGNNANVIPRINAAMDSNVARVYTYQVAFDMQFVEMEKLDVISFRRPLTDLYNQGIKIGFDVFAQKIAYFGVGEGYGLFNNPNITPNLVPANAAGSTHFDTSTVAEIIAFINGIQSLALIKSSWNPMLLPDTYLLPPRDAKALSDKHSEYLNSDLLTFLTNYSYGASQARAAGATETKFSFKGRNQLADAGTLGGGRLVAYKKIEEFVRMDMPYPLQMFYTGPNMERASYTSIFVGQISDVQMPYSDTAKAKSRAFGPVQYWDFDLD